MPIDISDVKVGGIYATATNQERRVLEITPAGVNYESRSGNHKGAWSYGPTKARPPSLENFAAACDRIVSLPESS
jgi:hypothetical protein